MYLRSSPLHSIVAVTGGSQEHTRVVLQRGLYRTHAVASHTPAGSDFPSPATKASALEASGPTPT